jgi:hypothetical protein
MLIEGDSVYVSGATFKGPGPYGLYLDTQASNACVNNNTFVRNSALVAAISANGSNDVGSGNNTMGLSNNLPEGPCHRGNTGK